jgi:hypothetical protein
VLKETKVHRQSVLQDLRVMLVHKETHQSALQVLQDIKELKDLSQLVTEVLKVHEV